jgi:hypothetical protein
MPVGEGTIALSGATSADLRTDLVVKLHGQPIEPREDP